MREAPDIVRRYLRAYVEALQRFKTDKNFSIRVIGKYSRIADIEALEETYQHYAVKVMPHGSLSDTQRHPDGVRRDWSAHPRRPKAALPKTLST